MLCVATLERSPVKTTGKKYVFDANQFLRPCFLQANTRYLLYQGEVGKKHQQQITPSARRTNTILLSQ
jgi:hypothetical protein